jgi:hypothetical protein
MNTNSFPAFTLKIPKDLVVNNTRRAVPLRRTGLAHFRLVNQHGEHQQMSRE